MRLVVVAAIVAVGSAWAANRCVDAMNASCFPTITDALADAGAGDVIDVAAGLYAESATISAPNLRLRGPQAASSGCSRTATTGEARIVPPGSLTLQIGANGVIVEGLYFQGLQTAPLYAGGGVSGYQVLNNRFEGGVFGAFLNSSGAQPSVVRGNAFRANNVAGAASGNGVYSDMGLRNVLFESNCVEDQSAAGFTVVGQVGSQTNVTFNANTAVRSTMLVAISVTGLTVTRSVISSIPTQVAGILLGGDDQDVLLTGNQLLGPGRDVAISDLLGSSLNRNVVVQCNRFSGGSSNAMNVVAGQPLASASWNWWGCNGGAGATGCDAVTGAIDAGAPLALSLSAPATAQAGSDVQLIATVRSDAGTDPCLFADDVPISFVAGCGQLSAFSAPTRDGGAAVTLSVGMNPGACTVAAQLDHEIVTRIITLWVDAGTPPDAGPGDAGPVDAGPSDAGAMDAGVNPADAGIAAEPRALGVGCGCGPAPSLELAALGLLVFAARRRQGHSRRVQRH